MAGCQCANECLCTVQSPDDSIIVDGNGGERNPYDISINQEWLRQWMIENGFAPTNSSGAS